ncbi:MAG: PASTA domain-containing protein [Candidatus Margulisbacteria bacterium]|nr:PASTA domain-containing protein [Candidatus Margulisiibacteriota bacterium]MBU1617177.1 PASTA domain-containing protein [Candidatus Margulisiibacteriota bacterium]
MITGYLTAYLVFIIVVSVVISVLFLRLKLPAPRILIPLIIFLILSPVLGGYLYLTYFDSMPEIVVPDVTGLTKQQAIVRLEEAQLKVNIAGEVKQPNVPEGAVASQRPEAGRRVKENRAISLMISSGKQKVPVPDLVGKEFNQATKMLEAVGMGAGDLSHEIHLELPEGVVLAQEPLPGEMSAIGEKVDLLISVVSEEIK